jgi:hypothetical protein
VLLLSRDGLGLVDRGGATAFQVGELGGGPREGGRGGVHEEGA